MKKFNLLLFLFSSLVYAQFDADGQLNFQGNIGLDDDKVLFAGIRYTIFKKTIKFLYIKIIYNSISRKYINFKIFK